MIIGVIIELAIVVMGALMSLTMIIIYGPFLLLIWFVKALWLGCLYIYGMIVRRDLHEKNSRV